MKLEDQVKHDYFISCVQQILTGLDMNFTDAQIEQLCIENTYALHLTHKKLGKWHLGIWAVGNWGLKDSYELNGETTVYDAGYGVNHYKPLTICVFINHDWTFDKFRPSCSDWSETIDYKDNDELLNTKYNLIDIVHNPIESYYEIIDRDSYSGEHDSRNKYTAYFKGICNYEIIPRIRRVYKRVTGYISTKLIQCISFFDRRVKFFRYSFIKSDWNPEYEIAVVFEYGKSDWADWKVYNFYYKLYQRLNKFSQFNIFVNFNYLDENNEMPDNIWRGIYWDKQPERTE